MITYLWNSNERRVRAVWRLVIQLFLFLGLSGIIGATIVLLGGIIVAANQGFLKVISDPESFALSLVRLVDSPATLNLLGSFISLVAMLLSVWITSRWIDRRSLADYGFHFKRSWWRDVAFGIILGSFLITIIFMVEYLAGWVEITGIAPSPSSGIPFGVELLMATVFFICVAITEELFSRGYQLRNIAEGLNLAPVGPRLALLMGYVLSSIIFGSMHLFNPNASLFSSINLIVAGLLLGLGFLLTGELAISIGLHFAWNFMQGNIFGFSVSGTDAGAAVMAIQQRGPAFLTGGTFGPEGGLLG